MKTNTEKSYGFTLFFLFSLLTLSIIPIYRILYFDSWPSGDFAYAHLNMGQYILSNTFPTHHPFLVVAVPFHFDPFDLILGIAATVFSTKISGLLLPTLLGLLTLYFLYRTLSLLFPNPKHHLIAGLFCLTSPLFIALFTEATHLCFITFCIVAGTSFFTQKRFYVSFLFFSILLFYGSAHLLLTILLLLSLGKLSGNQKQGNRFAFFFFICLIIQFFLSTFTLTLLFPSFSVLLQQLFSDVGGKYGISIFALFLSLFGVYPFFRDKKITLWPTLFICTAVFFTLFSGAYFALYLILPLSFFATTGLFFLLQRQWKIKNLRDITIFFLILGLIFSATSTISRTARQEPHPDMMNALLWLQENSYENAIILTSEKHANIVSFGTQRRVIYDRLAAADPTNQLIVEEIQRLYHTRNIETALSLFEHYQIDYVVVSNEMQSGLVWDSSNEGLLFVLKNGKNFKKVFENNNVAIWSVQY